MICFLIILSGALAGIGLNKEIKWMTVIGVIVFFLAFLLGVLISSQSSQSLYGVCARINGRLDGCVEVAQHVVGNNSRTYYLKIDVARLKELKKGYEPPQAVKPPTYDHAVITVEPSAPSKQAAEYTAPSKETGSAKKTGRTAAWTRAERPGSQRNS